MHTVSSHQADTKVNEVQLVLEGQRLKILEGGNLQIILWRLILIFHRNVGGGKIYSWKCQGRASRHSESIFVPGATLSMGHGH